MRGDQSIHRHTPMHVFIPTQETKGNAWTCVQLSPLTSSGRNGPSRELWLVGFHSACLSPWSPHTYLFVVGMEWQHHTPPPLALHWWHLNWASLTFLSPESEGSGPHRGGRLHLERQWLHRTLSSTVPSAAERCIESLSLQRYTAMPEQGLRSLASICFLNPANLQLDSSWEVTFISSQLSIISVESRKALEIKGKKEGRWRGKASSRVAALWASPFKCFCPLAKATKLPVKMPFKLLPLRIYEFIDMRRNIVTPTPSPPVLEYAVPIHSFKYSLIIVLYINHISYIIY